MVLSHFSCILFLTVPLAPHCSSPAAFLSLSIKPSEAPQARYQVRNSFQNHGINYISVVSSLMSPISVVLLFCLGSAWGKRPIITQSFLFALFLFFLFFCLPLAFFLFFFFFYSILAQHKAFSQSVPWSFPSSLSQAENWVLILGIAWGFNVFGVEFWGWDWEASAAHPLWNGKYLVVIRLCHLDCLNVDRTGVLQLFPGHCYGSVSATWQVTMGTWDMAGTETPPAFTVLP